MLIGHISAIYRPIMSLSRHIGHISANTTKLAAADPKRREDLKAALHAGAFRPGAACRLLRQLHGLSQADLAAMLGVNLKVIKALESGKGNPGFASIEKIAQAFGLAVVFVKKDTVAEIVLHLRSSHHNYEVGAE